VYVTGDQFSWKKMIGQQPINQIAINLITGFNEKLLIPGISLT
jgi:hypothetical protein